MESKRREKFVDLAEKRVSKALKDLRLVGNLANRNNYEFTDEDVEKIVSALQEEVKNVKKRFDASTEQRQKEFRLR